MKQFILLLCSVLLVTACSNNSNNSNPPTHEVVDEVPDYSLDISEVMIGGLDVVVSDPVVFGPVSPSSSQKQSNIVIRNTSSSSVALSISPPDSVTGFSIKVNRCPAVLNAGDSCSFTVAFSGRGKFTGPASGTLSIGADLSTLVVNLSASVTGQPNPNTLEPSLSYTMNPAFGSSSGATRTLVVSNAGPGDANALVVSPPNGYAIWMNRCPSTLASGKSCQVVLQYKGHRSSPPVAGSVSISSTSPAHPSGVSYVMNAMTGAQVTNDPQPVARLNIKTEPVISSMQRNMDTFTDGPVFISIGGNSSNDMSVVGSSMMMPNQYQVQASCPSSMTGEYLSLYVVNDGADDALNDWQTTFAQVQCNGGVAWGQSDSVTLTQRRIYSETLVIMAARRSTIDNTISEVKMFDIPDIKLYNSPPKLHSSSYVYFMSSGSSSMDAHYYSNSGSLVFEDPSILNPYHPEIGWRWSWMTCSTNIGNCTLDDTVDTSMGIGGVQRFAIRDYNASCGSGSGVFDLTLCSSFECQTSQISYQLPACVCDSNQVSNGNGGCMCDSGMGYVQDSTGTGCVMATQCNIHTERNSCESNNSSNSNFPACAWEPMVNDCSMWNDDESTCSSYSSCSWSSANDEENPHYGSCSGSYDDDVSGSCVDQ